MITKALFAYFHYVSFIVLICTLLMELVLFKKVLRRSQAKLIQKIDAIYGIAAILVLVTGGIRLFFLEKGYAYYISNNVFVTKLLLFLAVGLLSIYPTIKFIRWNRVLKDQEQVEIPQDVYSKILRFIRLEVFLVFLIPLMAALAARGFGF